MSFKKQKVFLWESLASTYQTKEKVSRFKNWKELLKHYIYKQARSPKRRKYATYAVENIKEAEELSRRLYNYRMTGEEIGG